MLRTGTDIIEISRIRKAVQGSDRFVERVFTPGEVSYCLGGKPKWGSLAARFAAKEAAAKALGTGIGGVRWIDIEVTVDAAGCPEIRLHGAAAERAGSLGISGLSVSLSHCRDYAVAFVTAY